MDREASPHELKAFRRRLGLLVLARVTSDALLICLLLLVRRRVARLLTDEGEGTCSNIPDLVVSDHD